MREQGYYWIVSREEWEGPEIAQLRGTLFFTTRSDGNGETVAVADHEDYVRVLAGPLQAPEALPTLS
jgi:hypothetical protein